MFRNNVGVLEDRRGQKVAYGLCVGSSDLIGFTPVEITPSMIGKKLAVFTAIEVKSGRGKLRPEQEKFIDFVNGSGGIAFVARSSEEAIRFIEVCGGGKRGF